MKELEVDNIEKTPRRQLIVLIQQ